jgi:hypothetical protein
MVGWGFNSVLGKAVVTGLGDKSGSDSSGSPGLAHDTAADEALRGDFDGLRGMQGEQAQEIGDRLVREVFVEFADELAQPAGVAALAEQLEFGSLDVKLAKIHRPDVERFEQVIQRHGVD